MNLSNVALVVGLGLFVGGGALWWSASEEFKQTDRTSKPSFKLLSYGEQPAENTWPGASKSGEIDDNVTAKNYYIIVDGSESMKNAACSDGDIKLSVAKSSLQQFIDSIPNSDNIGLYAFDNAGSKQRVPLNSAQHETVKQAIKNLVAGGRTPLGPALKFARAALTAQGRKQLGYGEYHLVIVTDGYANSADYLERNVRLLLKNTPIVVHTIGFCLSEQHTLNQPGYTLYRAANNREALSHSLQQILAEAPAFDLEEFKIR